MELNYYYRIELFEPYECSESFYVAHKDKFTNSEFSVMVYDVIDDYINEYASKDYNKEIMPCDINVNSDYFKNIIIFGLRLKYGFNCINIIGEASIEYGYIFRNDDLQSPFLQDKYKNLEIGQCKQCKRKEMSLFKRDGCPVENSRRKKEVKKDG